ncbi:hypothetical protein STEG23_016932 [Scotinomys teguina]
MSKYDITLHQVSHLDQQHFPLSLLPAVPLIGIQRSRTASRLSEEIFSKADSSFEVKISLLAVQTEQKEKEKKKKEKKGEVLWDALYAVNVML